MTPHDIYLEACRRGLRLEPRGDKLAVAPKGKCSPDFRAVLLAHKAELLAWLSAPKETWAGAVSGGEYDDALARDGRPHLTGWDSEGQPLLQGTEADWRQRFRSRSDRQPRPDTQAAWFHVARQILAGEFDGADTSTVESLTIGLRNIRHPVCQQALARLPRNRFTSRRK